MANKNTKSSQPKPINEYTNKDWKNLIIYVTFIGIFMAIYGVSQKNWDLVWIGTPFVFIGIAGGFVLHFFYGIKIIDLRRDFKNKKY